MTKLTAKKRKSLPKGDFVFPGARKYPIEDKSHARNALARVSQHGSASEIARVKAAIRQKFPSIEIGRMEGGACKPRLDRPKRG